MATSGKVNITERPDFTVYIDEENGAATFTVNRYRFSKVITIPLEEMPERYQTFFTKYLLCK